MDINELDNFPLVFKKVEQKGHKNARKTIRRLMDKNGQVNLQPTQIPLKHLRFLQDFATTLVLIRWRWVTLFVILANSFFYLLFAGLWMLDAWLSDDFNVTKSGNFCIKAPHHFTTYLLLSIETITTTGYGYLYPTENCTIVVIILTLSTIVMIFIDGAFISVVILKVCKPLKKDAYSIFSKKAVISLRNGKLCLVIGINDHLNKHLIESKITFYFVDRRRDQIGLKEMEINSSTMLLWPSDVVHEINEESPLWELSASDLMDNRFEIFVMVSGSSLVTNQFSTSQTSYLNEEMLWGFRFKSCIEFDDKLQEYKINEESVFKVEPCDTPLCSASKLKEIKCELNGEIF